MVQIGGNPPQSTLVTVRPASTAIGLATKDIEVLVTASGLGPAGPQGDKGEPGRGGTSLIGDTQAAARALNFIEDMLQTIDQPDSTAWIKPDADWPADYIGPVTGTYGIPMTGEPTKPGTPIVKAIPDGDLPNAYRGMVFGSLNIPTASAGMHVKSYKRKDIDYEMPSVGDVDAATKNWSIDLSTTPDWESGQWVFALVDSTGTQIGEKWPYGTIYTNIRTENRVITDTTYLVGLPDYLPTETTGRFRFPRSAPGRKQFRLVRPNGDLLADYSPLTGCVRSYLVSYGEPGYETNFEQQTYSYDQALCLIAAVTSSERELASKLADGLLMLQTKSGAEIGGFIFSGQQLSPTYGDPSYRTGAHCFCLYALLAYVRAWPHAAQHLDVQLAITRAFSWLARYLGTRQLYLGGLGIYDDGAIFQPSTPLTWAATEHNIDAWFCFDLAYTVYGTTSYKTKRDALRDAMMSTLWSPSLARFLQGVKGDGTQDTADPLDCHTWGGMFLAASGDLAKAAQVLHPDAMSAYQHTIAGVTGYAPARLDDPEYSEAIATVWAEGTYGAALAYLAVGDIDRWLETLSGMMHGQQVDGSYRYMSPPNPPYEWTNSRGVIGGAWSVMAFAGRGIWNVDATGEGA